MKLYQLCSTIEATRFSYSRLFSWRKNVWDSIVRMYGEGEEQPPDTVELQRCWPGSWDWARPEVTETEILLCCFQNRHYQLTNNVVLYLDGCENRRHIICRWPPECEHFHACLRMRWIDTCFEGCRGIFPHQHRHWGETFSRQIAQWAVCLGTPQWTRLSA